MLKLTISIGNKGVRIMGIGDFFENYIKKESFFINKQVLQSSSKYSTGML